MRALFSKLCGELKVVVVGRITRTVITRMYEMLESIVAVDRTVY